MQQDYQEPLSPEAQEAFRRGFDILAEIIAQDILEKRAKGIPLIPTETVEKEQMKDNPIP